MEPWPALEGAKAPKLFIVPYTFIVIKLSKIIRIVNIRQHVFTPFPPRNQGGVTVITAVLRSVTAVKMP